MHKSHKTCVLYFFLTFLFNFVRPFAFFHVVFLINIPITDFESIVLCNSKIPLMEFRPSKNSTKIWKENNLVLGIASRHISINIHISTENTHVPLKGLYVKRTLAFMGIWILKKNIDFRASPHSPTARARIFAFSVSNSHLQPGMQYNRSDIS